jgi:Arylsulfotransferase (ASST)
MGMSSTPGASPIADGAAPKHEPPPAKPRARPFARVLGFLGVASLCYVLGAAVMFFELPTASFLRRGFAGGAAWYEGTAPVVGRAEPIISGKIDQPGKTFDGFTLCMCGGNARAVLMNMHGDVVHEWHVPFSQLWTDSPHVRGPVSDATVYLNDGHVYPNGDLLAVVEGPITRQNASNGYGLVKLDKDSRVLWKYAERCHHDVAVDEDGTIYAIVNETVHEVPAGLEHIPTPCMVDVVDILSPEGQRLGRLRLLEAIHESAYAPLLCPLERSTPAGGLAPPGALSSMARDDALRRDVLHTNAITVLSRAMASQLPMLKAGQIMVSPRNLDAIVVLDRDSAKAVWAARGPWRAQHDPSFLPNGHLLLFDNLGSPRSSRVLEFDPQTGAFPWSYPGDGGTPFVSKIRGMCQRLANGNTLIVNSVAGEVFEVTAERELVWSRTFAGVELYRARRYTPDTVPFVKGGPRERP